MNIGAIIQGYREKKNLSRQELALKVRVGTKTIEKYESGEKVPDTQTALKLSTALDFPASEILGQEYKNKYPQLDQELQQMIGLLGPERAKELLRLAPELQDKDESN